MQRLSVEVFGTVQGVGFRPFVKNLADRYKLKGWVKNTRTGVRIEIQGQQGPLRRFTDELRHKVPKPAMIDRVEISEATADRSSRRISGFEIRKSSLGKCDESFLPPDLAICKACLQEVMSRGARRYRYPFTNCASCGPRFSVVTQLPYDRERTTMNRFPLCADCIAEYRNPHDRRFYAQAIACPKCGPELNFQNRSGSSLARGPDAMDAAIQAIQNGRIVAVKGIGGFQLCVNADDQAAVDRLRQRKRRPDKPLAVMARCLDQIQSHCRVSDAESEWLASSAAPIVLLGKRNRSGLAVNIAPGNPRLGVMLAHTPLHHILLAGLDGPVVCTSGNIAEEPICIEIDEALSKLEGIADYFLSHNRSIARPLDDSIVQMNDGQMQILRRARGFAPLPLRRSTSETCVLACGGQQKNTAGLASDQRVVLSQHLGNLSSAAGIAALRTTVRDLVELYGGVPDLIACDLHPDYSSTAIASELASEYRIPVEAVQHHHAHAVACMSEHGLAGPVLALCWDGTGYGDDGQSWGGEALVCDDRSYLRRVFLRPIELPGGERAISDPRRIALSMATQVFGCDTPGYLARLFSAKERDFFSGMLAKGVNCPKSGGIGRLFDGLAVLSGVQSQSTFDGHAAMALQFAAETEQEHDEAYPIPLQPVEKDLFAADWRPLVLALHRDRTNRVPLGMIAARVHNGLALLAERIAGEVGLSHVILTGGCFQNVLLTAKVNSRLRQSGYEVHNHQTVPPNDGGLALGQALVAAARMDVRNPDREGKNNGSCG